MIVDFEVVKTTTFGRFLAASFQDALRQLMEGPEPGDPSSLDMSALDIGVTLNGRDLDIRRVFSSFGSGSSTPEQQSNETRPPMPSEIVVSREWLRNLADNVQTAYDETHSVDSYVYDQVYDGASAAASVVTADVEEAAREAASDHSPGDSANYEVRESLGQARADIDSMLEGVG